MTAFVFNEHMQTLSQKADRINASLSSVPEGKGIRIGFWRWQNWNEAGNGDYDCIYLSVGDARELAYAIIQTIGDKNGDSTGSTEDRNASGSNADRLSVQDSG